MVVDLKSCNIKALKTKRKKSMGRVQPVVENTHSPSLQHTGAYWESDVKNLIYCLFSLIVSQNNVALGLVTMITALDGGIHVNHLQKQVTHSQGLRNKSTIVGGKPSDFQV
eukprot:snap_masked-scaffold_1-processed-gene-1.20-mRNA-1 protein AED:1.00 eAED:1.00 QI:0/-1/0/0/-1/1/1/0/110